MTDKELLELAAKAAGIECLYFDESLGLVTEYSEEDDCPSWWWNPLTDDGDAFRLAVKLHFAVSWTTCFVQVGYSQEEYQEGEDEAVATRRAIVRAAAEIVKEVK